MNVAILGMNEMAMKIFMDQFVKDKYVGYNVVGYFTMEMEKILKGRKSFGEYKTIPNVIRNII